MNQFFYTRTEEENTFSDSFNINKVIRTVTMNDGNLLVLLDDLHERVEETPEINTKTNKVIGTIRKRNTFQSEIYLSQEDALRFKQLTSL